MVQEIIINTGNELKFSIASSILAEYSIPSIRQKIETPEIQSVDNKEICEYSAKYAFSLIRKPIVVTDVSYKIIALNGFPGPFIKFINKWLTPQDILNLMNSKNDRGVEIIEFISLATSTSEVMTFQTTNRASIDTEVKSPGVGSSIDQLLIREGFLLPQNMLTKDQLDEYFKKNITGWHDLAKYIQSH